MNQEKKCAFCERLFVPVRSSKIYCSDACRYKAFLQKREIGNVDAEENNKCNVKKTTETSAANYLSQDEIKLLVTEIVKELNAVSDNVKNDNTNVKQTLYEKVCWKADNLAVKKVTQQFLTLLHSTLKLVSHPFINHDCICAMAEAYEKLLQSFHYKSLPADYPFKKAIEHYHEKFRALSISEKNVREITLRLSETRRYEINSIIQEIGDFVAPVKFSELKFEC